MYNPQNWIVISVFEKFTKHSCCPSFLNTRYLFTRSNPKYFVLYMTHPLKMPEFLTYNLHVVWVYMSVAYRRDRNLCDTLVHGKTNAALKPASISCNVDCRNCELLSRDAVHDTSNQLTFNPAQDITCRTRNVVYGILCTRCQATVYVGETERELRERMTEHLRDVRLKKDKPINYHFGEKDHRLSDMAFIVLEKTYGADRTERQLRESVWIKKLSTTRPMGCNIKDSYIPAVLQ